MYALELTYFLLDATNDLEIISGIFVVRFTEPLENQQRNYLEHNTLQLIRHMHQCSKYINSFSFQQSSVKVRIQDFHHLDYAY